MSKNYDELFVPTYVRDGNPMVKGQGVYLFDSKGKKLLDFASGIAVNALGHGHPALIRVLQEQGSRLLHASNLYFTQPQINLSRLLIKWTFGEKVFLCNSGTEAIEAAIKFARKRAYLQSPRKFHICSFSDGFHGRTYGALSATAQPRFHEGFGPVVGGFHYAPFNDIKETEKVLSSNDFAGIIIEPIQGETGINQASTEFLQFLRSYADRHHISLIFDEIQCGMGRTGTLWNYEQHDCRPDIMTIAKPLGGGLPLGAVVCTADVAEAIHPGDHGTTFGGNPLACALGCEVLKIVARRHFLNHVGEQSRYLFEKLEKLKAMHPEITEIRGCGLMAGIRTTFEPKLIIDECLEHGLLLVKASYNTVRILPPLIVENPELDKAAAIISKVISLLSREMKKGT